MSVKLNTSTKVNVLNKGNDVSEVMAPQAEQSNNEHAKVWPLVSQFFEVAA